MWVLINGLPPDSAFRRQGRQWTTGHELAALQMEKAEVRGFQMGSMWADEKSKKNIPSPTVITHPDRPEPEPEPGKKPTSDPATLARLFGGG